MQRPLVHAGLWAAATWAAVMLSWFGVSSVLKGTVYDPPKALSVSADADWEEAGARLPDVSSTQRPRPEDLGEGAGGSPSAETDGRGDGYGPGDGAHREDSPPAMGGGGPDAARDGDGGGDGDGSDPPGTPDEPGGTLRDGEAGAEAEPESEAGSAYGTVETVATDGGRVVLDLRKDYAELVSAAPEAGWEMQVWDEDTWIRVTFSRNDRAISVFCVWNGHPPAIEEYED
ncbi:hypothetical protein [Streptomyces sp. YIM 98790]|uniref:hypothetical protein n=1 Tax=Streptomyces sp. YIM 98790 TaxID=2689077 RepID=UPI0037DD5CA4